jgi:hypothetical protein
VTRREGQGAPSALPRGLPERLVRFVPSQWGAPGEPVGTQQRIEVYNAAHEYLRERQRWAERHLGRHRDAAHRWAKLDPAPGSFIGSGRPRRPRRSGSATRGGARRAATARSAAGCARTRTGTNAGTTPTGAHP